MIFASLMALLAFAASPALAQERARDYVQPRITRAQFQKLCQDVGLQSNQKQIAGVAFSDYESTLDELVERLDAEAIAAGRAKVDDSLSGKARVPAEELQRLRVAVLKVYLQAGAEVDSATDMLIGGLETLLADDQQAKFDASLRALRREIVLQPRASASSYQEYAGDGVDVQALVAAAGAEGGELAALADDALSDLLADYAVKLDQVLVETASADRQGRVLRKIASIDKDADAMRREEQAALQRWQRLYELNRETVEHIASYAKDAVSADAAEQFTQRFDRASFTWLYPRRKPDRQIEWMRQQNLAAETMQKAEGTYAQYVERRDGLSRSAIDIMLKARLEFRTILHAMIDQASIDDHVPGSLWNDLIKNTGEQAHLESNTSAQLEAAVDEATRQALREAMKRPDRPPTPPAARRN
jgi:hypothetical protein